MKRMKGVAVPFEASPSSYAAVYEDPRIRMRHQCLMHDFEDLYKETEAQKDKLVMMKKKKMTLLAEVRFLKQRYMYLKQCQSQKSVSEPKSVVQRPKLVNGSRTVRKEQDHQSGKNAAAQIDLNRKKKGYSEKEAAVQMQQIRNPGTIPDLNQKERVYSGKEASVRNTTPIFDLNQISMEEEELRANDEGVRMEEAKICVMRGGSDEQQHGGDMKLSAACRSIGNGSSRAGKRKISWQDQVALRV